MHIPSNRDPHRWLWCKYTERSNSPADVTPMSEPLNTDPAYLARCIWGSSTETKVPPVAQFIYLFEQIACPAGATTGVVPVYDTLQSLYKSYCAPSSSGKKQEHGSRSVSLNAAAGISDFAPTQGAAYMSLFARLDDLPRTLLSQFSSQCSAIPLSPLSFKYVPTPPSEIHPSEDREFSQLGEKGLRLLGALRIHFRMEMPNRQVFYAPGLVSHSIWRAGSASRLAAELVLNAEALEACRCVNPKINPTN
ncbi:hypothetical protein B0H13DRAFT_1855397 [Mycena leptocephala]|nr:hypothetical protein B0H13DRAFT_1855397 [Mycena leptocephala]